MMTEEQAARAARIGVVHIEAPTQKSAPRNKSRKGPPLVK
jgi:hypothetical protein